MLESVVDMQNRGSRPRTTLKELFCEDSPLKQSRKDDGGGGGDVIRANQVSNYKINNKSEFGYGKHKDITKLRYGIPKEESNKLNHNNNFEHCTSPANARFSNGKHNHNSTLGYGLNYGHNTEQNTANVNVRVDYGNPNHNSNGFGDNKQLDRISCGNLNFNSNLGYAHNYGVNEEQSTATLYVKLHIFTAEDHDSDYGVHTEQSIPTANNRLATQTTDLGCGLKTEQGNKTVNDREIDGNLDHKTGPSYDINHGTYAEQSSTRTMNSLNHNANDHGDGVVTEQTTRTVNNGRVVNGNLYGLFYGLKTEPASGTGNGRVDDDNRSHAGNIENTDSTVNERALDHNLSDGSKAQQSYSTVNSTVLDFNSSHGPNTQQSSSTVNRRVTDNNLSHIDITERGKFSVNQRVLDDNLSRGAKAEHSCSAVNDRVLDYNLSHGESTGQSTSTVNGRVLDDNLIHGENTVQGIIESHGANSKQSTGIQNARLLNGSPIHSHDAGYGNNHCVNTKQSTTTTLSDKVNNTPNSDDDDNHGHKHGVNTEKSKGRKVLGFRSSSVRKVLTFSQELVTARIDDKKVSHSGPLTAQYWPKQSALKRTSVPTVPLSTKREDQKSTGSAKSSPLGQNISAEHFKSSQFDYRQGQWHEHGHGYAHVDSASEQAMAKISEFEKSWESHYGEEEHHLGKHSETGDPEVEQHHPLCTEGFTREHSKLSESDKRRQNPATKLIKNIGRKLGDKDKKMMMHKKKQVMCTVQIPEGMVGLGWQEGIPLMLSSGSYRFPVGFTTGRCSFTLQKLQSEKATITVHGDLHRIYIRDGHLGVAWVQGKPLMLQPGVSLFTCPPESFSLITTNESPHLLQQKEFVLGPFRIISVPENEIGIKFCNRQPEILHAGRHYLSISRLEIFAGFESLVKRHTHVNGVNSTALDDIPVTVDVSLEWQIKAEDAAIARSSCITDAEGAVCEKVQRAIGLVMWNFDTKSVLKQPLDPDSEQDNKPIVLNETDPAVKNLSSNIAREFIDLFEESWSITLWELQLTKFVIFPTTQS